ncbi:MAG: hypothetical protein KDA93_07850 [Planctomycetaceae bacterium]|nr:hypothetical protein [Planctomycetaceae bacterium]
MWIWAIVAVTVGAGLLSIYGAWDTRKDILSGRPSYASLVDYTGISRPEELIAKFGEYNAEGRFELSDDECSRLPRKRWVILMDQPKLDLALIISSIMGGILNHWSHPIGLFLVLATSVWMLLSYAVAGWVVMQHPHLRE